MNKILQLFKLDLSQNRVFGLDILRFVAIFMVLLGHSMLFVPADIKPMFKQFLLDGVSIFFVLSGFLIGGILIKQLNREKPTFYGLLDFWKRRWMRTLPAYMVVLIALIVYTAILVPENLPSDLYRFFFFIQNFFVERPTFFAEAWSLSIEEWFYLSIPLLLFGTLILFKTSTKWTIFIVSVLVIAAITYYRFYLYQSYGFSNFGNELNEKAFKKYLQLNIEYQVVPRLDSIMYGVMGSFLAYYYPKIWQNKLLILLSVAGLIVLWYSKFKMYNSLDVNNSVFSYTMKSLGVFLLMPLLANLKNGPALLVKPITYFSLISYSMYLVNLNVVAIAIIKNTIHGYYGDKYVANSTWFVDFGLYWLFTILISVVMYKFIEIPFMNLRDRKKVNAH